MSARTCLEMTAPAGRAGATPAAVRREHRRQGCESDVFTVPFFHGTMSTTLHVAIWRSWVGGRYRSGDSRGEGMAGGSFIRGPGRWSTIDTACYGRWQRRQRWCIVPMNGFGVYEDHVCGSRAGWHRVGGSNQRVRSCGSNAMDNEVDQGVAWPALEHVEALGVAKEAQQGGMYTQGPAGPTCVKTFVTAHQLLQWQRCRPGWHAGTPQAD